MRTIIVMLAFLLCFAGQAEARHHHRRHHHNVRHTHTHTYTPWDRAGSVYLQHPPGCPRTRFCACGAAMVLFGRPIRSLWASSAWFRFPRTYPAQNMVAVRHGHVFVLDRPAGRDVWWVKDFNSGGHRSRYHMRSIRGYAIVNPYASHYASGSSRAL